MSASYPHLLALPNPNPILSSFSRCLNSFTILIKTKYVVCNFWWRETIFQIGLSVILLLCHTFSQSVTQVGQNNVKNWREVFLNPQTSD